MNFKAVFQIMYVHTNRDMVEEKRVILDFCKAVVAKSGLR